MSDLIWKKFTYCNLNVINAMASGLIWWPALCGVHIEVETVCTDLRMWYQIFVTEEISLAIVGVRIEHWRIRMAYQFDLATALAAAFEL